MTQVLEWPDGLWIVREWQPPPRHPLEGWVERIWHAVGEGGCPGYRVLPHGMTELTCTIAGQFEVSTGEGTTPITPGSWTLLQGTRPGPIGVRRLTLPFEVLGVRLHPALSHERVRPPQGDEAPVVAEVMPPPVMPAGRGRPARLQDRVGDGAGMIENLRAWLMTSEILGAVGTGGLSARVLEASRLSIATGGQRRIAELAATVGVSTPRFRTRFRELLGVSPKLHARVHRFRAAVGLVQAGRHLTEVAMTCGYADQAHLTREFQALGGLTPGGLRRIQGRYRATSFRMLSSAPRTFSSRRAGSPTASWA